MPGKKKVNIGSDWSRGTANIDQQTGIRYGVISQHTITEAWSDAEPDYGPPHCPGCGSIIDDSCYCEQCDRDWDSSQCYLDEPIGWVYDRDGYFMRDCLDSDVFVIKSPYYTYGQFCSPCVPGAVNLECPMLKASGAPKGYALGPEWFEGYQIPYQLYRVSDNVEMAVVEESKPCQNCNGTGRDHLKRVAQAQRVSLEKLNRSSLNVKDLRADDTFCCWKCDGAGLLTDKVLRSL
jgi:hypothetical protein